VQADRVALPQRCRRQDAEDDWLQKPARQKDWSWATEVPPLTAASDTRRACAIPGPLPEQLIGHVGPGREIETRLASQQSGEGVQASFAGPVR